MYGLLTNKRLIYEVPMEGNDVDDQPTLIISFLKLTSMPNDYQILQWSIFQSFQL